MKLNDMVQSNAKLIILSRYFNKVKIGYVTKKLKKYLERYGTIKKSKIIIKE